jgi:antitoxin CptB
LDGPACSVKRTAHVIQAAEEAQDGAMSATLDARRRRAAYRAGYRGTREMDWLLGRFAAARLALMDECALADFERLLAWPDPELHDRIVFGAGEQDGPLAELIGEIRRFHGLERRA